MFALSSSKSRRVERRWSMQARFVMGSMRMMENMYNDTRGARYSELMKGFPFATHHLQMHQIYLMECMQY